MIFLIFLILALSVIGYIIYRLFVKIHLDSRRFKKMDPNFRDLVSPLLGLVGLQEQSFKQYGDSFHYVKQMVKDNNDLKAYTANIGHISMLILCDPQIIKEFLLESKKFRKFNLYKHSDKGFS